MKFLFESPVLQIEAPVLSDRLMMNKVLKQNSACVLLECVLEDVKKPQPVVQQQQQIQQQPQPQVEYLQQQQQQQEYVQTQSVQVTSNGPQVMLTESYMMDMPKLPPGTIIVPQDGSVQIFDPQGNQQQQYYEVYQSDMLLDSYLHQDFINSDGLMQEHQQQPLVSQEAYKMSQAFISGIEPVNHFSPPEASQQASSVASSLSVSSQNNTQLVPEIISGYSHQPPVSSAPASILTNYSHHNSPVSTTATVGGIFSHNSPANITTAITKINSNFSQHSPAAAAATIITTNTTTATKMTEENVQPQPQLIYPDMITEPIYKALKAEELAKIIFCHKCQKKFTFLSEHLAHMKVHNPDVESVSQMSINIWIQGRKLKCDHCKHKSSYTLDYARHMDTHPLPGLACRICQCGVTNPKEYGEHMEIHHPSVIFSQPAVDTQQQQQPEQQQQQQLIEETGFTESSHQDLLATEEMLNIVSTDNSRSTSVNPLPDHNPMPDHNPLPDHSAGDDFLYEEDVFEAILDGEQSNHVAITPQQSPAILQNTFG